MIHDLAIQYAINNDQYTKTLQEAVDVMRKVNLKPENNNDKRYTQNRIKMDVARKINGMNCFAQKYKHEKMILRWLRNAC